MTVTYSIGHPSPKRALTDIEMTRNADTTQYAVLYADQSLMDLPRRTVGTIARTAASTRINSSSRSPWVIFIGTILAVAVTYNGDKYRLLIKCIADPRILSCPERATASARSSDTI